MKRLIGILLAVALLVSCVAISTAAYSVFEPGAQTVAEAVEEYEILNETEVATNRYFFLMPDGTNGEKGDDAENKPEMLGQYAPSWYNKVSNVAGIYWWGTVPAAPTAWAGYRAEKAEAPRVFYADVPQAVTTIIWNNGVDGGMDNTLDIYYLAAQTINIPSEYYEAGESDNYPDGTDSFDNMIFVIDPDYVSIAELSLKQTCGGEWYYYYGNGCYGFTKDGTEADCLRDDHFDENGNHVIPEATPEPSTEKHTDAPTEPETTDPELPTDESSEATEPTEPTTEPAGLLGDVDNDGQVTVLDATQIQMFKAAMIEFTDAQIALADFDGDGQVTVLDATTIQLFRAGLL